MTRGILTVSDLKARSVRDSATHCWHWQGAKATDGTPRIWTVDHERAEKRCMSGPKAVWNIAHCCAPRPGWLVFRRCVTRDCVNPSHMAQARDKSEIGDHIARNGARKGKNLAARRANAAKGRAALGIVDTPPEMVRLIRSLSGTNVSIALQTGVSHGAVSRIRRLQSRSEVAA